MTVTATSTSTFLVTCLFTAVMLNAAPPQPENIYPVRKAGFKGNAYYQQQAQLWEAHLAENPGDIDGWYACFLANIYRFRGLPGRQEEQETALTRLRKEMAGQVPDSYAHHYATYYLDQSNLTALENAVQRKPELADLS